MTSACQRAVLTCARCRKRKIKCDRQLPSCTQCLKARATCLGLSPSSVEIPRSLVLSLKNEIAQLEAELGHEKQSLPPDIDGALSRIPFDTTSAGLNTGSDTLSQGRNEDSRDLQPELSVKDALNATVLASDVMQAFVSSLMPSGSGSSDLLLKVRLGMTPSSASIGSPNGSSPQAAARNTGSILEMKVLASMPPDIVRALLREYIAIIEPQYSFLNETAIWQHLERVALVLNWNHDPERPVIGTVVPSHDFVIVYLVLAIAVTLEIPKGAPEDRCMSLSTSLFAEGIGHFSSLNTCPSETMWLQTMLLMLLYATIIPQSVNVWVLSGAAMRACVELGLHREVPAGYDINANSRDVRRMIFWATYCMDRSVCSALQLPLSIPDIAINTRLPQNHVNATFLSSIEYHQLLSEMIQVHFQNKELSDSVTWDEWLVSMDQRLRHWRESHPTGVQEIECADFRLARGLMILHRPSPRIPVPSDKSLLLAFESASRSAQANQTHIESGSLRRPWLSAHHTLEAAMVVLFCLRHGYQVIRSQYKPSQVFQMTKLFTTNFLIIAAQGWPEASTYGGIYERLLNSLLEPLFSSTSAVPRFTPAQDTELTQLLYPSPAQVEKLRLGHQLQLGNLGWPGPDLWDMDYNFLSWDLLGIENSADEETGIWSTWDFQIANTDCDH